MAMNATNGPAREFYFNPGARQQGARSTESNSVPGEMESQRTMGLASPERLGLAQSTPAADGAGCH